METVLQVVEYVCCALLVLGIITLISLDSFTGLAGRTRTKAVVITLVIMAIALIAGGSSDRFSNELQCQQHNHGAAFCQDAS